jgi:hypothetical protein
VSVVALGDLDGGLDQPEGDRDDGEAAAALRVGADRRSLLGAERERVARNGAGAASPPLDFAKGLPYRRRDFMEGIANPW